MRIPSKALFVQCSKKQKTGIHLYSVLNQRCQTDILRINDTELCGKSDGARLVYVQGINETNVTISYTATAPNIVASNLKGFVLYFECKDIRFDSFILEIHIFLFIINQLTP